MNEMLITSVICPHCHRECEPRATTCDRCGSRLDSTSLQSGNAGQGNQTSITERWWFIVIILLHVGFLGIPYYLKLKRPIGVRIMLCLTSIAYTAFVVAFVIAVGSYVLAKFSEALG